VQPDLLVYQWREPLARTSHGAEPGHRLLCRQYQASYSPDGHQLAVADAEGGGPTDCSDVYSQLGLEEQGELLGRASGASNESDGQLVLIKYAARRNVSVLPAPSAQPAASPRESALPGQAPPVEECAPAPSWLALVGLDLSEGSRLAFEGVVHAVRAPAGGQPQLCRQEGQLAPSPAGDADALGGAAPSPVLETLSERRGRTLAAGSSRLRIQQGEGALGRVVEVCFGLLERVEVAASSFAARDLSLGLRIEWPAPCTPGPQHIEVTWAKLVPLEAALSPSGPNEYTVRLPQELVDAYPTGALLGNLWLRLVLSPQHWIAVPASEPASPDPDAGAAVLRRRTEVHGAGAKLFVPQPGDLDQLVAAIAASHGLADFAVELSGAGAEQRLQLADSETGFVYLSAELVTLGELGLTGPTSTSLHDRSDPRNEALIFALGSDERQHSLLSGVALRCALSSPEGLAPAAVAARAGELACMLPLPGDLAAPADFTFRLEVHSGFEALYLPLLVRPSGAIPHQALAKPDGRRSASPLPGAAELVRALEEQEARRVASRAEAARALLEAASRLNYEARLLYDQRRLLVLVKAALPADSDLGTDLLARLSGELARQPGQLLLEDARSGRETTLEACTVLLLDAGPRVLSLVCSAAGRQLERGVSYAASLSIGSLGRLALGATVERPALAQETLRFEVRPRALVTAPTGQGERPRTLTLTLLNGNLGPRSPGGRDGTGLAPVGAFTGCLVAGEEAALQPLH
jgi:hypothetical protein